MNLVENYLCWGKSSGSSVKTKLEELRVKGKVREEETFVGEFVTALVDEANDDVVRFR